MSCAQERIPPTDLPERLRVVLESLQAGKDEKQIAQELELSVHTVRAHIKRIYKRYGVHSRAELLSRTMVPRNCTVCVVERAGIDTNSLRSQLFRTLKLGSFASIMLACLAAGYFLTQYATLTPPASAAQINPETPPAAELPAQHVRARTPGFPNHVSWPPEFGLVVAVPEQGVYYREGCEHIPAEGTKVVTSRLDYRIYIPCPHCKPPLIEPASGLIFND